MNCTNVRLGIFLVVICGILMLPLLGLTDFNTKGEPREAILALSMWDGANPIFPLENGKDMPYKPLFFHWCIYAAAKIFGSVNEFTSRLPSALAFLVMLFCTVVQIKNKRIALLTGLILFSMFEVHRAAMACRVDMMLAAAMTVALCGLFHYVENDLKGFPFLAVIAMSVAVLTKGPVGVVLPCIVAVIFSIVRRKQTFGKICFRFFIVGIASLLIPGLWYYQAYRIAGDSFLSLVVEENFGRFMGKMSYESHSNPFFMPLIYLLAGSLPYSIFLLLLIPPSVKYISRIKGEGRIKGVITSIKSRFLNLSPWTQFCIICTLAILLFYCIPSSKRSVYLLPLYPFYAYLMAKILMAIRIKLLRLFTILIVGTGSLLALLFITLRYLPDSAMTSLLSAESFFTFVQSLRTTVVANWEWPIIAMPVIVLAGIILLSRHKRISLWGNRVMVPISCIIVYMSMDAVFSPMILNTKSDKFEAQEIMQAIPANENLYSYCEAPMMRFFAIDFYTGGRIQPFALSPEEQKINSQVCRISTPPLSGYILIPNKDFQNFMSQYGSEYDLTVMRRSHKKGCDVRDYFTLYKIIRK